MVLVIGIITKVSMRMTPNVTGSTIEADAAFASAFESERSAIRSWRAWACKVA